MRFPRLKSSRSRQGRLCMTGCAPSPCKTGYGQHPGRRAAAASCSTSTGTLLLRHRAPGTMTAAPRTIDVRSGGKNTAISPKRAGGTLARAGRRLVRCLPFLSGQFSKPPLSPHKPVHEIRYWLAAGAADGNF